MKSMVKKLRKYLSKSRQKKKLHNYGVEALNALKLGLGESGLKYWIEFGTLLGAVRSGGFISHDLDIDLAVESGEGLVRLDGLLLKKGFQLKSFFEHEGELFEKNYIYKGKVEIDIFIAHEKDDKYVIYDCVWDKDPSIDRKKIRKELGGSPCYENRLTKFEVRQYDFLGVSLFAPDNLEQHLVELYGEDYMTPNPGWRHSSRAIRRNAGFAVKRTRL